MVLNGGNGRFAAQKPDDSMVNTGWFHEDLSKKYPLVN